MSNPEIFPLSLEPDPDLCLKAIEEIYPAYLAADERVREELKIDKLPPEDQQSRLELLDVMYPLPEANALAGEAAMVLFERDVSAFHFQNQNNLQFLLSFKSAETEVIKEMIHTTYEPNPMQPHYYRARTDFGSGIVHQLAMDRWRSILTEVSSLNGWSSYIPDVEFNQPEHRHESLPVYVFDSNSTAYFHVSFWPYSDVSVLSKTPKPAYGLPMARIRKWATLTRGTEITQKYYSKDHIMSLQSGCLHNLQQVPDLDELVFFEKALAAYY